jgi:RNAse (barnase) inhibitor barstar
VPPIYDETLPMFAFEDERKSHSATVCVNVPARLTSKKALLATLAAQLRFPDYFGENWDALEECLSDLSWLPVGPVIVIHADLPLINDIRNAKIYVVILRDAVRKMSKLDDHPLSIVFPDRCRDQVSWLLRSN